MPLNNKNKSSDTRIEYAKNKCIFENGKLIKNEEKLEDNYSKTRRFK